MKIGVVTITEGANYGNKLQNYAMLKTLEKIGFDAENVKKSCDLPLPFVARAKRSVMKTLKIRNHVKINRQDKFKCFNKNHLKYSEKLYTDTAFSTDDYKAVVCGSDQIWNVDFDTICNEMGYYFADFAPKNKRMAFSASIGVDEISDKHKKAFVDYVNKMEHISVREYQAAKIIEDLTGRQVPVTIDPTLMLDREDWLKLAKKPDYITNQKFVLSYFLGEASQGVKEFANNVAKANNCQLIKLQNSQIADISNDKWFATDPAEFVWLVANCEAFVTDSFHGCVFSTIFKKPFRWFSRTGGFGKNMNSRMETLFDKLHLGDWCIGNTDEPTDKIFDCDYSSVDENLANERKFAYDYLKEALK